MFFSKEDSPPKVVAKLKVSSSTNTTEHLVKKPAENKKLPAVTQNTSKPPGKSKKEEPAVTVVLKVKPKEDSVKKVGLKISHFVFWLLWIRIIDNNQLTQDIYNYLFNHIFATFLKIRQDPDNLLYCIHRYTVVCTLLFLVKPDCATDVVSSHSPT